MIVRTGIAHGSCDQAVCGLNNVHRVPQQRLLSATQTPKANYSVDPGFSCILWRVVEGAEGLTEGLGSIAGRMGQSPVDALCFCPGGWRSAPGETPNWSSLGLRGSGGRGRES